MSAIETDDGWYQRMAERAAVRRQAEDPERRLLPPREQWPVPPEIRGASARDAFLWYICDGWRSIFGDAEPIETLWYHDFGHHVLRKGSWQLTLVDLGQFTDQTFEGGGE